MKTIRILTFHRVVNNGAVLQNAGLLRHLKARFPECDVKTLDYTPWNMAVAEFMRATRPHFNKPLFGLRRYTVFRNAVNREIDLDTTLNNCSGYATLVKQLDAQDYDLLITGSDCIWRVTDSFLFPRFPSIFWLSDKIRARKMAYAASANKYIPALVATHRDTIRRCLDAYDLVTVRDDDTLEMLRQCGVGREIHLMPDPAFLYDIGPTRAAEKLEQQGLKLDRPICALLHYGAHDRVAEIVSSVRAKGYQIAALSMYSPYADVNLGDVLDPFEWAEAFRYMRFCVTDRFHGCVFCLKNHTPFLAIETTSLPPKRCKKWQLLSEFDLADQYLNVSDDGYSLKVFEQRYTKVMEEWDALRTPKVQVGLAGVRGQSTRFDPQIEALLNHG